MRNLLLSVFTIFIVISSNNKNQENPDNSIIIAGKLNNYSGVNQTITFGEISTAILTPESGEFHFSTELNHPIYANLKIKGFSQPIFCVPGDSIFITANYNENNKFESVQFFGDHAKENNFLVKRNEFIKKERSNIDFVEKMLTPINQIDSIINDKNKLKMQLFSEHHVDDMHPLFKEFEYWFYNYMQLVQRNYYFYSKTSAQEQSIRDRMDPDGTVTGDIDISFPDNYYDIVKEIAIDNRDLFLLNKTDYARRIAIVLRNLDPILESTNYQEAYYNEYFTKAKNLINDSLIMEEFYFLELKTFIQRKQIKLASHFLSLISNSKNVSEIQEKINKITSLNSSSFPEFISETPNGKKIMKKDLLGKYTYIDFWATWCVPCIKEIPYLKELEQRYHGKNIRFLSISIDRESDKAKWKKMVIDKGLTGLQVHIDPKSYELLSKEMMINTIPRFMLLDPKGKLIENSAPRPSSSKIRSLLDKLEGL